MESAEAQSSETLDDILTTQEDTGVDATEAEEATEDVAEEITEVVEEAESTPDSEAKDEPWQLTAVLDEREKRQKAQARADELEQQLADLTKKPEADTPDVFADQEGFVTSIKSEIESGRMQDRMDLSREFMSMIKDDYSEREEEFLALAKDDSALIDKLRTSPNPAKFAYDTAVKHSQFKEMENIDEWRDKERAKLKEELLEEINNEKDTEAEKEAKKRDSITPSLASNRSAGGLKETPSDDLTDILGG